MSREVLEMLKVSHSVSVMEMMEVTHSDVVELMEASHSASALFS